jgi:predicted CXXCH cytochrome family protein/LSD1 subclass zinc finger protein
MRRTSLSPYSIGLLVAILVVIFFAFQSSRKKGEYLFSAGKLTPAHAFLEAKCQSCHQGPFQKIEDSSCLSCHSVSEHSKQHPILEKRCVDCHGEHSGEANRTPKESALCLECHKDLKAVNPNTKLAPIHSFDDHPEFNIAMTDPGTVKLNHTLHMKKQLQSPNGATSLRCDSCHKLTADLKSIQPVTFEENCRSCHALSFDDRLPASAVPHGDTDAAFQFLIGEYAKLFGGGKADNSISELREVPGREKNAEKQHTAIIESARQAENVLFTKTACQLCHAVAERQGFTENQSRYEIKKADIKSTWFTHARFSHAAHQNVSCISCHKGAETSKDTSDVNLPSLKECSSCHMQAGKNAGVPSECSMCHAYHVSEILKEKVFSESIGGSANK